MCTIFNLWRFEGKRVEIKGKITAMGSCSYHLNCQQEVSPPVNSPFLVVQTLKAFAILVRRIGWWQVLGVLGVNDHNSAQHKAKHASLYHILTTVFCFFFPSFHLSFVHLSFSLLMYQSKPGSSVASNARIVFNNNFISEIILPNKLSFLCSWMTWTHHDNICLWTLVILILVGRFWLDFFQPLTSSSWSAIHHRATWSWSWVWSGCGSWDVRW